jgi:putative hydrolase of the HAD superfamily
LWDEIDAGPWHVWLMQGPLPKAIFLDMDDTILADSVNSAECLQTACEKYATALHTTVTELRMAMERASDSYWADRDRHRTGRLDLDRARLEVASLALRSLGEENKGMGAALAAELAALRDAMVRPFPGAIETLRELRQRGVATALLTNGHSSKQRAKIARFGLAAFFQTIVIESEFGAGKPDERVYRHALAQLHVEPRDTWMVGDNLEWDVAGPMRLGIFGIWLDHQAQGLPAGSVVLPDRIIRALPELTSVG